LAHVYCGEEEQEVVEVVCEVRREHTVEVVVGENEEEPVVGCVLWIMQRAVVPVEDHDGKYHNHHQEEQQRHQTMTHLRQDGLQDGEVMSAGPGAEDSHHGSQRKGQIGTVVEAQVETTQSHR